MPGRYGSGVWRVEDGVRREEGVVVWWVVLHATHGYCVVGHYNITVCCLATAPPLDINWT